MVERNKLAPFYLKIPSPSLSRMKEGYQTGIYSLKTDKLKWERSGISTLEANWNMGEVLIANAPLPNVILQPNVKICTIEGVSINKPIFVGKKELSKDAKKLIKAVYRFLEPVK